jgi:hypothetical protein
MPRFSCPHCHQILTAPDEQRGTILACNHCGRRIKVPARKPAAAAAPGKREQSEFPALGKKSSPANGGPVKRGTPSTHVAEEAEPKGESGRTSERKRKKKKMAKPGSAAGVLGLIGTVATLAVLGLVLSGRWVPLVWEPLQKFLQDQGIPPLPAIIATGLVLLIPLSLWQGLSTKSAVLQNIAVELEFLPATVDQYKALDTQALERWTKEFTALGFTHLMDYRVDTEIENYARGFARLFVHPEQHCFGEINQGFASGGQASPMGCNLSSYLEDGWSFSTGNRRPSSTLYLLRRPKGLWVSRPDEPPEELLRVHLKRRKKIADDLGLEILTDTTAESYFDHERQAALDRKAAVQGRSFIRVSLDLWLFDRNPKFEWMGNAARAAARKKKD